MLRFYAAGLVLAVTTCAPALADQHYQPRLPALGQTTVRRVIECKQSRLTIDNPDDLWNGTNFSCTADGYPRIINPTNY